jgi:hypothetical protein
LLLGKLAFDFGDLLAIDYALPSFGRRFKVRMIFAKAVSFLMLIVCLTCIAAAGEPEPYGIYCVNGKTMMSRQSLEEMKTFHGSDVCRLHQDTTEAGAQEKLSRFGGSGAPCTCPQR